MTRELHLSAALDGTTDHRPLTGPYWSELVRLAEQGTLDFVTLDDSFLPAASAPGQAVPPTAPATEDGAGRLDAVAVLARAAPGTSRIGLIPTVTTTHTEPFHTSTALATLDFVSEGRAGWLIGVSGTVTEALAFGRRDPAAPPELWSEAADAAEVVSRLWDSWQDDAEIRDAATGRFIDRDRLHYIDFAGPYFSVRGPSIVPRPPQGRPPVAVTLGPRDLDPQEDGGRRALAARYADLVLLDAADPGTARTARARLRRDAEEAGRRSGGPRVCVRIAVDLTGSAGHDGLRPAGTAHFAGSPAGLAEQLGQWHAADAADGFHLLPASPRADLSAVVHDLVPLLRERGLFRSGYTGRTLRDHLGLSRPAGRYTPEAIR